MSSVGRRPGQDLDTSGDGNNEVLSSKRSDRALCPIFGRISEDEASGSGFS